MHLATNHLALRVKVKTERLDKIPPHSLVLEVIEVYVIEQHDLKHHPTRKLGDHVYRATNREFTLPVAKGFFKAVTTGAILGFVLDHTMAANTIALESV